MARKAILETGYTFTPSTNTNAAANIDLNATQISLSDDTWNVKLNSFIVYNRGFSNAEII